MYHPLIVCCIYAYPMMVFYMIYNIYERERERETHPVVTQLEGSLWDIHPVAGFAVFAVVAVAVVTHLAS